MASHAVRGIVCNEMSRQEAGTIDMKRTGEMLHRRMEAAGISVRDLTRLLDVGYPQTVYRWIRGETLPSIDHFYRMARIFGCRVDDLIVGTSLHKV